MARILAKDQPAGFRNHLERVAVVGAGGQVGSSIARALIAKGFFEVTSITRKDSKSTLPKGLAASKQVDYNNPTELAEALQGQDAVVITLSPAAPKEFHHKIIDAAVAAGVRYIMPNEYGTDHSIAALAKEDGLGEAELARRAYVEEKAQGKQTYWIALTSSFWYEFSLVGNEARYGFDVKNKKVTFFDDGNTRICTTTWAQSGRAVANLFALKIFPEDESDRGPVLSDWQNEAVYVNSFTLSQREMLASVLRVTGDKEGDWTIAHEPSRERYERGRAMLQNGDRTGFSILLYTRVFYPNGGGDYSQKIVNDALDLPSEDQDESTRTAFRLLEDGAFAY